MHELIGSKAQFVSGPREIGQAAFLPILRRRFANVFRPICDSIAPIRLTTEKHVAESTHRIEVAAGRADAVCRDEHARADHDAFVDRIPQRDIHALMAVRSAAADIAHGREASLDSRTRSRHGLERLLRSVSVEVV